MADVSQDRNACHRGNLPSSGWCRALHLRRWHQSNVLPLRSSTFLQAEANRIIQLPDGLPPHLHHPHHPLLLHRQSLHSRGDRVSLQPLRDFPASRVSASSLRKSRWLVLDHDVQRRKEALPKHEFPAAHAQKTQGILFGIIHICANFGLVIVRPPLPPPPFPTPHIS